MAVHVLGRSNQVWLTFPKRPLRSSVVLLVALLPSPASPPPRCLLLSCSLGCCAVVVPVACSALSSCCSALPACLWFVFAVRFRCLLAAALLRLGCLLCLRCLPALCLLPSTPAVPLRHDSLNRCDPLGVSLSVTHISQRSQMPGRIFLTRLACDARLPPVLFGHAGGMALAASFPQFAS